MRFGWSAKASSIAALTLAGLLASGCGGSVTADGTPPSSGSLASSPDSTPSIAGFNSVRTVLERQGGGVRTPSGQTVPGAATKDYQDRARQNTCAGGTPTATEYPGAPQSADTFTVACGRDGRAYLLGNAAIPASGIKAVDVRYLENERITAAVLTLTPLALRDYSSFTERNLGASTAVVKDGKICAVYVTAVTVSPDADAIYLSEREGGESRCLFAD